VKDAQTTRARELRRDSTKPERICWELLRDRRLSGIKFRRQHPIGPYFADFACVSAKLVIEIDGEHHALQVEHDARRTAFMERQGWRVLRFSASHVLESPEGIWTAIDVALAAAPSPNLSPSGGEEHEGQVQAPLPRSGGHEN
jgi:very-short-patch-repair endonuclease